MLAHSEYPSAFLCVVRIASETLDASAALALNSQIEQALRSGIEAILVDLGAPTRCAHAGLAGLIEVCSRLAGSIQLGLCNAGEAVMAKLREHGLDRALSLFRTIQLALNNPKFRVYRAAGLKAVVLCAGEGRRMRPMTRFVPKPMLDVAGKPVIARILDHLGRYGLNDVSLNPGFLGPQIPAYLRFHRSTRQTLTYFAEGQHSPEGWQPSPLGSLSTLARLNRSHFAFSDDTFVLCGDALIDIDLADMLEMHRKTGAAITIASKTVAPELVSNYGILVVDGTGRITSFQEKPSQERALSLLANTGIYLIRADVLDNLMEIAGQDIATDLFPAVLESGLRMQAYSAPFNWSDIGCGRAYFDVVADVLKGNLANEVPTGEKTSDGFWMGAGAVVSPWADISGPCFIGAGARVEAGAKLDGACVIGPGSVVESTAILRDSILWSGTRATGLLDQMIAGGDWAVKHRFADGHQDANQTPDGLRPVSDTDWRRAADSVSLAS